MNISLPADVDRVLSAPMDARPHDLPDEPSSPLRAVRMLQLAVCHNDGYLIRERMAELPDCAPARGVRLFALAALQLWDEVLAVSPEPYGATLLDIECSMYAYIAHGIAYAQTGEFARAERCNWAALLFAQTLGLKDRQQTINLELQRVMTLQGKGDPEAIARQLMQAMPLPRRLWGQRTHAEALMAGGSYSAALRSLGANSEDTPHDAALREYLHAIMNLPASRPADHPLLSHGMAYTRLAVAYRKLSAGDLKLDLSGIQGEPQRTYAEIMKICAMYITGRLSDAAVKVMTATPCLQPDQAFSKAFLRLACFLKGADVEKPECLIEELNTCAERLRPDSETAERIFSMAPDVVALLYVAKQKLHPRLRHFDQLSVPVLVGKTVYCHGVSHTVPGRIGRDLVLETMGLPTEPLHRQEKQRLKEVQQLMPRRWVNMGFVALGCLRLAGAYRKAGLPALSVAWDRTYKETFEGLSAEVQERLLMHTEFTPKH